MDFSGRIIGFGVVALAVALSACTGAKDKLYLRSETIQPLEVPPDLVKPTEDKSYEIPQIGALLNKKLRLDGGDVRLERDGRLRWLVVTADSAELWQRVHDFWVDSGVTVAWEAQDLGMMETEWVTNADSRFSKDKYRIRIEPGKAPGTADLFLSHRGIREEFIGGEWVAVWGNSYNDRELEVEVLGRLLRFLGVQEQKAKAVTDEAAKVLTSPEVKTAGDGTYILLDDPLFRAWQRVGLALDREGFEMIARDREHNVYRVRRPRPASMSPGLMLVPRERKEFQIRLAAQGEQTRVEVTTPEGQAEQSIVAKEILSRLQSQLW